MKTQSIHPRVRDGRTFHDKVDTCAPPKRRVKAQERYTQRLQNFQVMQRELRPEQRNAFKMPGSRNPKKLRNRI